MFLPKAHNRITHSLKLREAEEFTRYFLQSLDPLRNAGKLGPILFQLAPSCRCDAEALREFLRCFPNTYRAAFEFRHASWFCDEVYEILRGAKAGLCLAENENMETPDVVTTDFVYLRLRKPDYSAEEIAELRRRVAVTGRGT